MDSNNKKTLISYFDWIDSLAFALVMVIALFTFGLKSYVVDGSSMVPTLTDGQRVFAWDALYSPKSGDIVVLDSNNAYGKPLIKRIVAVGGQTLDIDENGVITVDGVVFDSPVPSTSSNLKGRVDYPLTVPETDVFVMGDNRGASLDSRDPSLGTLDERCVLGKVIKAF